MECLHCASDHSKYLTRIDTYLPANCKAGAIVTLRLQLGELRHSLASLLPNPHS